MKRNPFALLLISFMIFLTSLTYAQENNYITSRYDFIPGEKVIFFDDFTSESIGDFPAQWLTNGSGEIVKEDPSLKLQVVGHTDSDGDEVSNLDLSKRRGVSVKNELVSKFVVDAGMLETDGKGETEPIAENNSSVNKAKNRRVEFISMKEKPAAPADTEWSALTTYLGGEDQAGGKLKEAGTSHWSAPNTGATNETGFTALPGGGRNYDGSFVVIGTYCYFWSSTVKDEISAKCLDMYNINSKAAGSVSLNQNGFSVRCLKD